MKEYLDSIIEFLEDNLGDNYIWITCGAAALLLVIIIAVVTAGRKKSAQVEEVAEDRDFFLEGEYDTMIRDKARAKRSIESEPAVIEGTEEEQAALKEELQQVQINISIERGQVHIGYEDDGRLTCVVEEMLKEAEENEASDTDFTTAGEPEAQPLSEGNEILANQSIVLEKIELVKAAPAKKFGPDNFNTGRSGRIFTEEELREQIKQ